MTISCRVKEANKAIYDRLADGYDAIDGRRSGGLSLWVRKRLQEIVGPKGRGGVLLDVGCGTGFALKAADGLFSEFYGVDISENILKPLSLSGISPICADVGYLPFKERSVDVAVLFSVIHHLYDFRPVLREVHRVLKPHGVIYIDHDINRYFYKNFYLFIKSYRRLSRKEHLLRTLRLERLYRLSEFHSEGIDTLQLTRYVGSLGFKEIEGFYHWYGLSGLTNLIFGGRGLPRGMAPLYSLTARKEDG